MNTQNPYAFLVQNSFLFHLNVNMFPNFDVIANLRHRNGFYLLLRLKKTLRKEIEWLLTQCGNYRIFLSLRFYVKSKFSKLVSKAAILTN